MKVVSNQPVTDTADLLAKVADEFSAAVQRGEHPDIEAYADQYPEISAILRDVLPALTLMNRSALDDASFPLPLGEGRGDEPSAPSPRGEGWGEGASRTLGDFRLIREIGRGGMGVVYEAEQISLGRTVALKVLPFAAMLDERQLTRFRNEARAAAALHHTNIVPVFSVGCERGVHYYAMQYIEGESLARIIEQLATPSGQWSVASGQLAAGKSVTSSSALTTDHRPPSTDHLLAAETAREPHAFVSTAQSSPGRAYFRNIAELGIQAAEALDHAHEQGVIHRDIKPANLLLDESGRLWIADFGLARLESDAGMTMTGDLVGTLRYMSPEQALAKRVVVDHRTDIYSLGVTLYELLALRPAFDGEDRQHLLKQIAFEEPPHLRKLIRQIPAELETIVEKAIRKNPADRYATAKDLVEDLRSFLANKPIRAKPPTVREQTSKWLHRHPAAVRAAVLFLIATTIISVGSALFISSAYRRESASADAERKAKDAEAHERQFAEANAKRAEEVSKFLVSAFRSPDPQRDGRTVTIVELLDRAAAELQGEGKLADEPLTKAQLLEAIGQSYQGLGLPLEAVPQFERTFELRRKALGRENGETLSSMEQLINALEASDRTGDAAALAEERLNLCKAAFGSDHPQTLGAINGLAAAYWRDGRERESRQLFEETLALRKAALGPDHPDTLKSMKDLAECYLHPNIKDPGTPYLSTARTSEGILLCEETLRLMRAKLGTDHDDTIAMMSVLAEALLQADRGNEAVQLLEEALKVTKAKYGSGDTRVLGVINNLACRYSEDGRVDEAAALWGEALDLSRSKLGPNSAATARLTHNLAVTYRELGRVDDAISLFKEVDRLNKATLGPTHKSTLFTMRIIAVVLDAAERYGEAEAMLREIIRVKPEAAEVYPALLVNIASQHKGQDAAELTQFTANLREATRQRPDDATAHSSLAIVLATHAQATRESRDWDEAASEFIRAFDLSEDTLHTGGSRYTVCRELARRNEVFERVAKVRAKEPLLWIGRAQVRALSGNWDEAAADYAGVIRDRPLATDEMTEYAFLLVLLGDMKGFERFAHELLARPRDATDGFAEFQVARACSAALCPTIDTSRLVTLATQALEKKPDWSWFHGLGLAQYRAANYEAAIKALEHSNALVRVAHPDGIEMQNWLVLAMAHYRLGDVDEAHRCLKTGREMIDVERRRVQDEPLHILACDWIPIQVLLREADALISGESIQPGEKKDQPSATDTSAATSSGEPH